MCIELTNSFAKDDITNTATAGISPPLLVNLAACVMKFFLIAN